MSNGHWRTGKQIELYADGKSVTQRVLDYVQMWERRCYSEGIPDEVPSKLAASGRAPSYKALALSILRNDWKSIGFGYQENDQTRYLMQKEKSRSIGQHDLF